MNTIKKIKIEINQQNLKTMNNRLNMKMGILTKMEI